MPLIIYKARGVCKVISVRLLNILIWFILLFKISNKRNSWPNLFKDKGSVKALNGWSSVEATDCRFFSSMPSESVLTYCNFGGILPIGPYLPFVSMAGRVFLAGCHRIGPRVNYFRFSSKYLKTAIYVVSWQWRYYSLVLSHRCDNLYSRKCIWKRRLPRKVKRKTHTQAWQWRLIIGRNLI